MTPWMDAIDKLRSLGYSFMMDGGKLSYTYRGRDDPIQDEITPLLEVLKVHKSEIIRDPHFLIGQTIQEINQAYPEVRNQVKDTSRWEALSEIEREINRTALEDDFEGLGKALEAYRQAVLTVEDAGSQGNLFQGGRNEKDEPGSDRG